MAGPGLVGRVGKGVSAHCAEEIKLCPMCLIEGTYSSLDVADVLSSGEVGCGRELRRGGEDIRTVDERRGIATELTHSLEDELEAVLQLGLVRCIVISSGQNPDGYVSKR